MKKTFNLFIVESPLQLVTAIEAAHYFCDDVNTLIIRYTDDKQTEIQINETIKFYLEWAKVHRILPHKLNFITGFRLLSLVWRLNKVGCEYSRIFIGDYRAWYVPYILKENSKINYYLLDDGNSTVNIQKNYLSKNKLYFGEGIKGLIKLVIFNAIKVRYKRDCQTLHLFTGFNLKGFNNTQTVICHNFEFWKNLSRSKIVIDSTVYFFGGPISELKLLSLERELELLNSVYERYKSKNINMIYIAHRRDSKQKILCIKNALGIKVNNFRYCAEIEMLLSEVIPFGIASFYSTTLYTLPKLLKFEMVAESFRLPIKEMPKFHHDGVASVYNTYQKIMNVVDL